MPLEFTFPFFRWCDRTALGEFVRSGSWQFPMIETFHILSLTVLIGTVVVVNLRLMGVLMKGWTVSGLMAELRPYLNWSLIVILLSGVLLFLSEAEKAFPNPAFWVKIYLLFAAIVFHYTVVVRMTKHEQVSRATGVVVGVISLILWLGIGWAGRAIAFV
ncbi:MAG: DUF6644 family protein [Bryobacteraceae bacterium]